LYDPFQALHQDEQAEANNLQGYWLAIYEGVSLCEHFVYTQRKYDISIWTNPSLLPPGMAAVLAFCFGVFGAVMGMAQVWFIGPIGKKIGSPKYGGDVGFELAFAFAFLSHLFLRYFEKKQFGR